MSAAKIKTIAETFKQQRRQRTALLPDAAACVQACIDAAVEILDDASEEIGPGRKGVRLIENKDGSQLWLLADGTPAEVRVDDAGCVKVTLIDTLRVSERYGAHRFDGQLRLVLESLAKFDDHINRDNQAAIAERNADLARQ